MPKSRKWNIIFVDEKFMPKNLTNVFDLFFNEINEHNGFFLYFYEKEKI